MGSTSLTDRHDAAPAQADHLGGTPSAACAAPAASPGPAIGRPEDPPATPRPPTRPAKSHEIRGPGGVLPVDPKDDAALALVMLIEGETSGRPLEEVLEQFGRSRSTYYEKLRRYREGGLEGLMTRPPGPRTSWRRPIEVVRFIVTMRLQNQDRTAVEIARELARLGHPVSVRSVERTLNQFGLTRAPHRAAPAPTSSPRRSDP